MGPKSGAHFSSWDIAEDWYYMVCVEVSRVQSWNLGMGERDDASADHDWLAAI